MRIKIVRCSNIRYWYRDRIGKEFNSIRQVSSRDFDKYKLTEGEDCIGDYIVEENEEEVTMRSISKNDIEIISNKTESTSNEPISDFKEESIPTINHPSYYNKGKIEVIYFIEDQELNFNLGNAVKYISRAGKKNVETYVQDLKKAIWYLEREVNKNEEKD